MKHIIKEACVETIEEAIRAEKKGADRIELCPRLDLDGLTPDDNLIKKTIDTLSIPIKVMIRPRGGNFIYTNSEIDKMKESIRFCKKLNVQGVVFGVLEQDNRLNLEQLRILAELSFPMEVTIHKAIDQTPDILNAVVELSKIKNITSILTSGGARTAIDGKEMIKKMIRVSGSILKIISAGKITKSNFIEVHKLIGASEYHGRHIVG